MFTLKNPFTKSTPAPDPVESSMSAVTESNNTVKRWQLEQGRTRKRVEDLTGELEAARRALSQQERKLGEMMVDQLDTTSAAESFKQANDHIRTLEAAVAVATEKDATAQAELQQAERELKDAAKDAARARVLALAQEGEELFVRIKLFRADLVRETAAAYAAGGIASWGERETVDYFDFFFKRANRSAAADRADSGAFMKYPNWTTCLEYVCGKIQP